MDYRYWCTKLTEEELKDWEVEMLMYHTCNDHPTVNERFLTEQFNNFCAFIGNSFDWSETKKGGDYWYELSREER